LRGNIPECVGGVGNEEARLTDGTVAYDDALDITVSHGYIEEEGEHRVRNI